jgi:opacity protein-like surface antigen
MKRIFCLLVLIGVLMVPVSGYAAAAADTDNKQIGIYIAPKFVYGLTQMSGTKLHETNYKLDGVYNPNKSYIFNIGNKIDSAFGCSFAIGYDFEKKFDIPIRTEIEYSIQSNIDAERSFTFLDSDGISMDTDNWKQTLGIQTLFVNAYWDINTETKFTPYLGAGLGLGIIKTKFSGSGWNKGNWSESNLGSNTETNFAWNAGAGLGYDVTDNWTIDGGYRFVGLGSVKTSTHTDSSSSFSSYSHIYSNVNNLFQHQLSLGVRYTF